MIRRGSRRRRGFGLVIVIGFALILSGVLLSVTASTTPLRREAYRTRASDQAVSLAEAGVLVARKQLEQTPAFSRLAGLELGGGTIDVTVERVRGGGGLLIRSQAAVGAAGPDGVGPVVIQHRIEVEVELDGAGRTRVTGWRQVGR